MGKFLIGLIFGVAIAIGVVYYLNNSQTQFISKFSNVGESNTNPTPAILSPSTKIKEVNNGAKSQDNSKESDFDFYQILQDNKDGASSPVPAKSPEKAQITTKYVIQAGSFADITAAKDMKARLAFAGFEAKIKQVGEGSNATNKVVLGPYDTEDAAKSVQQELSGNGVKSVIIKLNQGGVNK